MSGYGKKERYLLYSFFPILFIGFVLGVLIISTKYYIPLFVIFLVTSASGFLIINNLFGFETINQDLNPKIIQRRRQEEKLAQLEEKRETLLQELNEKTIKLEQLVSEVSAKFEKKKEIILLAIQEYNVLNSRDSYFTKYDYHNWYQKWSHLDSIVNLYYSLDDIPISYQSEMEELQSLLNNGEPKIDLRNQKYVKQELVKHETYFNTLARAHLG